jgi:hypothetical protein
VLLLALLADEAIKIPIEAAVWIPPSQSLSFTLQCFCCSMACLQAWYRRWQRRANWLDTCYSSIIHAFADLCLNLLWRRIPLSLFWHISLCFSRPMRKGRCLGLARVPPPGSISARAHSMAKWRRGYRERWLHQ